MECASWKESTISVLMRVWILCSRHQDVYKFHSATGVFGWSSQSGFFSSSVGANIMGLIHGGHAKAKWKLEDLSGPKDLNCAVLCEYYPLPTIEDIATRLHQSKVFTILDIHSGFWHISLDEESSKITTFNTFFGQHRWKRLPFGISSAPEVFQTKMHELIEGLSGVEVKADDFAVVGFEESMEDAI